MIKLKHQDMNIPKLLVVDKSIFHSLCCCEEKSYIFARDYNIVLPDVLAIECLISENQDPSKNPERLVRLFDASIKAGAKYGYSSYKLFQAEKTTLCPAMSVIDERTTERFKNSTPNITEEFIRQEAEYCRKVFKPIIESVLKIARALYDNLCKREELSKKLRKDKDRIQRFKKWIQDTDKSMKDILKRLFSEQISSHADVNWFTWQMARLYLAYTLDWTFKKNLSGSSEKRNISNDLYDIEYVTYLSRVDGLLTNDKKLQLPLAKAAFPNKDIFVVDTSKEAQDLFCEIIHKVPHSYTI